MPGPEMEATIAFANATADALHPGSTLPPRHQRTPLSTIYSVQHNAWIDQEGNYWDKDGNRLPTANGEQYDNKSDGVAELNNERPRHRGLVDDDVKENGQSTFKPSAAPPLAARATEFMTPEERQKAEAEKKAALEGNPAMVGTLFNPGELAADPILRFFEYAHLPPKLQLYSAPFGSLAQFIVKGLPRSAERTVALRKLLESKDAGVRAAL